MQEEEICEFWHCEWGWGVPGPPVFQGMVRLHLLCVPGSGGSRSDPLCPQVTLLSFSVESEFTFVDYIRGG